MKILLFLVAFFLIKADGCFSFVFNILYLECGDNCAYCVNSSYCITCNNNYYLSYYNAECILNNCVGETIKNYVKIFYINFNY